MKKLLVGAAALCVLVSCGGFAQAAVLTSCEGFENIDVTQGTEAVVGASSYGWYLGTGTYMDDGLKYSDFAVSNIAQGENFPVSDAGAFAAYTSQYKNGAKFASQYGVADFAGVPTIEFVHPNGDGETPDSVKVTGFYAMNTVAGQSQIATVIAGLEPAGEWGEEDTVNIGMEVSDGVNTAFVELGRLEAGSIAYPALWRGVVEGFDSLITGDTWTLSLYGNAFIGGVESELTAEQLSGIKTVAIDLQTSVAIPEPGTYAMLCGLGLVGAAWYRRRRNAK